MNKQWLDYPHEECPECGSSVQIETDCPQDASQFSDEPIGSPPFAYSGDRWRCSEGHEGSIYCDSETTIQLEVPYGD